MDEKQVIKKTALYDEHVKQGAKIVEFAGFWMPVVFSTIFEEHRCVRSTVGIFDVSHMGEFIVKGKNALDFVQKVTINDASKLIVGQVQYSAFCYPDGGIVDDLLVYRFPDHYMLVVNASNTEKDFSWVAGKNTIGADLKNISDDITELALQGPKSLEMLQTLTKVPLAPIKYYYFVEGSLAGVPMTISRTGYTGELGFELYFENKYSKKVFDAVMEAGKPFGLKPIGLGARDTLRLEKKMCLYGNDITKDTNPLEAGIGWITKLDKGDFIGRDALLAIKSKGIKRLLVAFEVTDKGIPRHGYPIVKDSAVIGEVTSGTFSPSLSKGIGLGYVKVEYSAVGTAIGIDIRGKVSPAVIIKPPFI